MAAVNCAAPSGLTVDQPRQVLAGEGALLMRQRLQRQVGIGQQPLAQLRRAMARWSSTLPASSPRAARRMPGAPILLDGSESRPRAASER